MKTARVKSFFAFFLFFFATLGAAETQGFLTNEEIALFISRDIS